MSFMSRTSFGFHPFQFSYPPRKLTMEEMLYKFIDEGRREHEEIGAFIREFKTTNKLLLKERNNSPSKLKFKVYGLSKAINDAQLSNYEVKGMTTRGGKTTTEIIRNTNDINNEPPMLHHDKPIEPNEVLVETKPQETKEQTIQPPIPLIPFPHSSIAKQTPIQGKRPWNFTIPCDIGHLHINNALADLGASISLMPYTMYEKLGLGEPKHQSIKRPPAEDDECYGIDFLDTTIHSKTKKLLEDDQLDSFLVNNLEESIDLSDLGNCDETDESRTPIRRIEEVNTSYSQETKNEHLYSASANEIDKKKRPVLKDLPSHLEYAYLKGDESCPVIISSKLTEEEKFSLLHVLEKRKGAISCPWVSPIHVVPKKGGMTVVLNDINELILSRTVTGWRVCTDYRFFQIPIAPEDQEKTTFTCPYGTFAYTRMSFGLCNAPATFQRCMTAIFHDVVEDCIEVFMDDFSVCEVFDVWGLDFMGPFPDSRGLFARFRVPKALISDRGICNSQVEKALLKYGVTHKISIAYHPQTNGQTEVTNKAIKCILERSIGYNPKDWSEKLNDALWAFRTAYKTLTGCTPFRMVYGRACHLLVEIEHKAY
ncbi:reverse transcriptase domain-containing protein [Tanacetum coccineum]